MEYSAYELHTRQVFTDEGRWGVKLMLVSPILSGIFYWLLFLALSNGEQGRAIVYSLVLIACGLAFIGGGILIIIGRRQITAVNKKMVRPTTQYDHGTNY